MEPTFSHFYRQVFVHPQQAFRDLIQEKQMLRYSFFAVLIMATLYTFVYVFLIFGGGTPFKPWLNIPPEVYYRYNVFFCAPSMFLGWIFAAGVMHALSRFMTQSGTFEQTLAVLGFGIGIASWSTGVHDLLTSFLGAIHVIDQRDYEVALNSHTIWRYLLWVQMLLYVVWFVFLFAKSSRVIYSVNRAQAFWLGLIGFLAYQFFFFIFNR